MILIIAITIIWVTVISSRAYYDFNRIREGGKINHALRACFSLFSATVFSYVSTNGILYALVLQSLYWILFDAFLNKLRGKDLLYVGTTAWLDKTFHNIYLMLGVKILCLIISIGIFLWF